MATDLEVLKEINAVLVLRRAYERQDYFAFQKAGSVANATAFVSPAAFVRKR